MIRDIYLFSSDFLSPPSPFSYYKFRDKITYYAIFVIVHDETKPSFFSNTPRSEKNKQYREKNAYSRTCRDSVIELFDMLNKENPYIKDWVI